MTRHIVPYPLRATCLTLDFVPFAFWWPSFTRKNLTEDAKKQASVQWWFRFACFQISYRRML